MPFLKKTVSDDLLLTSCLPLNNCRESSQLSKGQVI